ncbi:MAG: DUF1211 domain-containing protein [Alphaproteobacteria bacterium]|nr:DUF1211 domain-containing protein [Alphaproteobacteria bacterium]
MGKERLLAMTDGVTAIIITIMVLELKVPEHATLEALAEGWHTFLAYAFSFIYVAIYWNNHHHYFHLVHRVNGALLWANFNLLFWISLVPFATAWMGETEFAPVPTAVYGLALFLPALSWWLMQRVIMHDQGPQSLMRQVLGRDLKANLSPLLYASGIGSSLLLPWLGMLFYFGVALIWLVPDRRIEHMAARQHP